jgi:Arc/MetJ-type ribon-helix-helix transcriptional regulator
LWTAERRLGRVVVANPSHPGPAERITDPTSRWLGSSRLVGPRAPLEEARGMTYHHTMPKAKVALTLDEQVLARLDRMVQGGVYPNRSQAVEAALREKLERLDRTRLARECAKLDPDLERALAEEGLAGDLAEWPAY